MNIQIEENQLKLLIIGDWGRRGMLGQQDTANALAIKAADLDPLAIISTGDNFYEHGVKSIEDKLWKLSFEDVFHHESLQRSWYCILGNHDHVQNPLAQVEYSKISKRWNMPNRYYSLNIQLADQTEILMLFLDTSNFISDYDGDLLFGSARKMNPEPQLEWFEDQLANTKADWKIVVGHHPLYSAGIMHGDQEDMIEIFEPLFQKYSVHAYFCGHEHDLQHLKFSGPTHYFVSGAGSEVRRSGFRDKFEFAEGDNGFAEVVLDADLMQVNMINSKEQNIYSTSIAGTPASAMAK